MHEYHTPHENGVAGMHFPESHPLSGLLQCLIFTTYANTETERTKEV